MINCNYNYYQKSLKKKSIQFEEWKSCKKLITTGCHQWCLCGKTWINQCLSIYCRMCTEINSSSKKVLSNYAHTCYTNQNKCKQPRHADRSTNCLINHMHVCAHFIHLTMMRESDLVSLNFYWELKISKAFYWTSSTSAGHAQKLSFNFHDALLTLVRVWNWPKFKNLSLSLVKIIKKFALQWFLNNNGKIRRISLINKP